MKIEKALVTFLTPCLLAACASKARIVNQHIEDDFFAEVTYVEVLNTDVDTLNEAAKGAVDGAIIGAKGNDRHRRESEREGREPQDFGENMADVAVFAVLGAVVGSVKGMFNDVQKTYYKYEFGLRNVDSNDTTVFHSDTLLNHGDCVYVDVGEFKNQKHVEIKKVDEHVCESHQETKTAQKTSDTI